MRPCRRHAVLAAAVLLATISPFLSAQAAQGSNHSELVSLSTDYRQLVSLFEQWRAFEHPVMHGAVPDYTAAAMQAKARELPAFRSRIEAFDTSKWTVQQKNDLKLVRAEMNGFDFNLRVLRPWARDPAFYLSVWDTRSDCPLREGPLAWPAIELYNYRFPLSPADAHDLTVRIGAIPALLQQARLNLKDFNAHDLWFWGAKLRQQSQTLASLQAGTLTVLTLEGSQHADISSSGPELHAAIAQAHAATDEFIAWLEQLAPQKTGPSGIGIDDYNWYEANVHLIPYTWQDQVTLLRRELERAQAALRLEEHNNRNLPPLEAVKDAAAYNAMGHAHLDKFAKFLVDQQIIPDKPYIKAALEPQLGEFVPEDQRVFFTRITHREPMLLMSHQYHWIDLARMRDEPNPNPIRRLAPLSNIWDTRAEGFATAFEEIVMHAGLYDDNPRARELVWIMLANRAARGLASLYVQANQMNLEQAQHFQAEWTPRGWAVAKDKLTVAEQLLYLRQPGYGTCYITGKILVDQLITNYSHQQELTGKPFVLRDFMDRFNNEGMIPVLLMEEEMVRTVAAEIR